MALACLRRPEQRIRLYEVLEGDLKELPEASLRVIRKMGGIDVVRTGMTLEKRNYQENKSLRSPLYIYNLLRRLGDKHCALCGCEIPEIIQGAHVWPVSKIKKAPVDAGTAFGVCAGWRKWAVAVRESPQAV